jgi:hypothetical protein
MALRRCISGTVLLALIAGRAAGEQDARAATNAFWFPVGEKLVHRIYWGWIPVGRSVTTTEWIEKDGKRLLAIRMRTRTNKLFDKIRPVNDRVESIVDPESFRPLKFSRLMIRRRKVCNETTVFDHKNKRAEWKSACSGESKTFDIAADTQDVMTFMYYTRREPFPENTEIDRKVMADDGVFDLKLKTRKKEQIKLKTFGRKTSLKIEPRFDFDGLLIDRGKFKLWVSDDKRRVLTKAVIDGKLADIKVVLCQVHGPGDDSWTEHTRKNAGETDCEEEAE